MHSRFRYLTLVCNSSRPKETCTGRARKNTVQPLWYFLNAALRALKVI